jgi:hypothetical protein
MEGRGPVRLSVRTSDFHSGKRGSIPLRATKGLFRKSFFRFYTFNLGNLYPTILTSFTIHISESNDHSHLLRSSGPIIPYHYNKGFSHISYFYLFCSGGFNFSIKINNISNSIWTNEYKVILNFIKNITNNGNIIFYFSY